MSDNPQSPLYGFDEIVESQSDAAKRVTGTFRALEIINGAGVLDRDLTAPPATTPGVAHIIAAGATGVWATHDNKVAIVDNGQSIGWKIITPQEGMKLWCRDEVTDLVYKNSIWHSTAGSQALTDGPTVPWDLSKGALALVTLGGNRTMGNPTNTLLAGQVYHLRVTQDAVGGRTLAFGVGYKFSGGDPVPTAAANAVTLLSFVCDGTFLWEINRRFSIT